MSGSEQHPGDDPTRRVDRPDDATRPVERPGTGQPDEPTRRIEPPAGTPAQRYRPADHDHDPTAEQGAVWEGQAEPHTAVQEPVAAGGPPGPPARQRRTGRAFGLWLLGLVMGFVIAFVVVALTTDDPAVTDLAGQQRIAELEGEVADADARISDLEAQLAEAEAAAGDRAEDVEQQRQALDERAAVLDEWAEELGQREQAVAEREVAAAAREEAVDEAVDDAPGIELPDIEMPEIDDETVDSIVQRILDGLRDLFR